MESNPLIKELDSSKTKLNEPLGPYTTLKVGGPADILYTANSSEDIVKVVKLAKKHNIPVTMLGWGSNVLISDSGIRALVVRVKSDGIKILEGKHAKAEKIETKTKARLEQADKEKYYRGWPKESMVTYFDPGTFKKMKEITPVEFGEKEGYYYRFFENGKIAVAGEFQWDHPVGDWIENYPDGKRKRIIAFPKEPFDERMKPYIKVEWNDKGKEIYRNNKMVN